MTERDWHGGIRREGESPEVRPGGGQAGQGCSLAAITAWAPLTPVARRAMAHFVFEADLYGLLKLDTPIPNASPARWQRKAKESGVPGPSPSTLLSPMKPANRSHSSSKTPSRTPGERRQPRRRLGGVALSACLAVGLWIRAGLS